MLKNLTSKVIEDSFLKFKRFLALKDDSNKQKKVQERATNIANAILGKAITIERKLKKNKSNTLAKEKIKQMLNL